MASHFVDVPLVSLKKEISYVGEMGEIDNHFLVESKEPWQDQVRRMIAEQEKGRTVFGKSPTAHEISYLPAMLVVGIGALSIIITAYFLRKADAPESQ